MTWVGYKYGVELRRDAETILNALQRYSTWTFGDPLGRADCERIAKQLLTQLRQEAA